MTTIDDCRIIDFPRIIQPQGNLTPVHGDREVPFDIARVYYLYDVPGGSTRGGHAHYDVQEVIVSAMGSFCVELDDGSRRKSVRLSRAYYGLYVPQMVWRELVDFSSGSITLVLASLPYDEKEYIRHYEEFRSKKGLA